MKNLMALVFLILLITNCRTTKKKTPKEEKYTVKEETVAKLSGDYKVKDFKVVRNQTTSLTSETYTEPRLFFTTIKDASWYYWTATPKKGGSEKKGYIIIII